MELSEGSSVGEMLPGALLGIVIQFFISSAVIWFVVNHMMSLGEKTKFKKCMLCVLLLTIVGIVAVVAGVVVGMFVGFLGVVIGILVYYKGSIAAIEGSIEVHDGSMTIWVLYTLINFGTQYLFKMLYQS